MAAYLDPNTYRFLTNDERESVEKEIVKLFPARSFRNNNQTQSQSSQLNEEPKNMLDIFANKCNFGDFQALGKKKDN